jgi:hypothetical protein
VFNCILSTIWYLAQTPCKYLTISGPDGWNFDHLGFGQKEKE